jgi:putative MATE family efflux protein
LTNGASPVQDLTQGSIARHLLSMAVFIGAGLAFQAAYFLVDLYFVSAIGPNAIAGVSAAGNTSFLVMAASQLVGVGVTSLVARAVGRRDEADARLVFNQSLGMAAAASLITLVVGYAVAGRVVAALTANAGSAAAGSAYLRAFLPSLAAMFPMTALTASLRGAGVVRPTMLVQTGAVLVNALLAPVLIAGWITHYPLGTAGAGLASSIAGIGALLALVVAFPRIQPSFSACWALLVPRLRLWWRIIAIGLPVAGEFAMLFLITTVVYWVIRHFGAPAQAGFGIGSRIMTSIFLPAMAVAFAVAPVAGQNMGAVRPDRVRATFYQAALLSSCIMVVLSVVCHSRPDLLIAVFTRDPAVTAVAAQYLRIVSWNFVAVGLVFVCSGMFQAMGNTIPSFLSSSSRLVTYALPAIMLEGRFDLATLWYMSVASATLQAVLSLLLLRRELRVRLAAPRGAAVAAVAA